MIPEGWAIQTLEDLASVKRGKFTPRPRNDPRYYGGEMPFVQTGDITSAGKYLTKFSQTLNNEGVGVSKVFPPNSILITIAANIGHTAITTFDVACPDSVVGIQPIEDRCDVLWLKDVLETKREELDGLSTQNAQKNINLEVLKPLRIVTPPLPEQRKIAEILSTWDRAIKTVEALITNARAQKKALMQSLLTGKQRLTNFSGAWRVTSLGQLGKTYGGLTGKSKADFGQGHPFVTYKNVFENAVVDPTNVALVTVGNGERQHRISLGDILFTTSSETPNEVGMTSVVAFQPGDTYLNSFCFGFRPNSVEEIVPEFAAHFFRGDEMRTKIAALAQGSTRYNISKGELLKLRFALPDPKEQQAIAQVMDTAAGEIRRLKDQLTTLRQEKSALMQQLLTGKRRVKVDEREDS